MRQKLLLLGAFLFFLAVTPVFLPFLIAQIYAPVTRTSVDHITPAYSALVLGAGIKDDGSPSDILYDRIAAGVQLYKAGKVKKIIMSGDNRFKNYSEPDVMKKVAMEMGVPDQDIQPDYAGRRTYDSCWRAKHIFDQTETIVVTQSFHITRAVFLCNQLGISTQGFIADVDRYADLDWQYWSMRDRISLNLSLIDIFIRRPQPVGGAKIDI